MVITYKQLVNSNFSLPGKIHHKIHEMSDKELDLFLKEVDEETQKEIVLLQTLRKKIKAELKSILQEELSLNDLIKNLYNLFKLIKSLNGWLRKTELHDELYKEKQNKIAMDSLHKIAAELEILVTVLHTEQDAITSLELAIKQLRNSLPFRRTRMFFTMFMPSRNTYSQEQIRNLIVRIQTVLKYHRQLQSYKLTPISPGIFLQLNSSVTHLTNSINYLVSNHEFNQDSPHEEIQRQMNLIAAITKDISTNLDHVEAINKAVELLNLQTKNH